MRTFAEISNDTIQKNGTDNLTTIAYHKIKNDILLSKLKPDECISGSQLAKNLNMSRTPVREALNILESEGLVDIRNGVGIFIKSVSEKEVLELFEVRCALECTALESLVRNLATPEYRAAKEQIQKLENDWLNLKNKYRNNQLSDLQEIVALDYETHNFIIKSSDNAFLVDLVRNIEIRIRRVQYLSVIALNDAQNTINQHFELVQSINKGEKERAVFLLKTHIQESVPYIFQNLKTGN